MMTIVEGTPGAGKTTYLGSVLVDGCAAGVPPVIWPEARLPARYSAAGFSSGATYSLLEESITRLRLSTQYDAEFYSDRSYLTVLAFRHALERQGLLAVGSYQEAVSMCIDLRLPEAYSTTSLILFEVSAEQSVQWRTQGVVARGEDVWWNRGVIDAMNAWYSENLERYFRGQLTLHPVAVARPAHPAGEARWEGRLIDGSTCTRCGSECRSRTGWWKGRAVALFGRGLHVQDDEGPRCYSDSAEIMAWHHRRREAP